MSEQYETPKLTEVGKIGDLTHGGGGQQTDMTGSDTVIELPK